MSDISGVTVTVPATTANIGPGFDCLGAALTLNNRLTFSLADGEGVRISVSGIDADRLTTNTHNLAYQAFLKLYDQIGQAPPAIALEIELGVPLSRGLGSSATAIVGGLLGANVLAGSPLSTDEVMGLAIALEGHPDNVVPALRGGCSLTTQDAAGDWLVCDLAWHPDVIPVVAIPNFELSTAEARRVLPQHYSRADAIFNTAHMGLLVRALETGHADWLRAALHDRIHQPYRQTLIHGYEIVRTAALDAGAHGLVISGAGPTVLALTSGDRVAAVQQAMVEAWQTKGITAQAEILQVDTQGAIATIRNLA